MEKAGRRGRFGGRRRAPRNHGSAIRGDLGDLAGACRRLDGRGYPAYGDIEGEWDLGGGLSFHLDRVARDPFAPPSRARLRLRGDRAGFPPALLANPVRRIALADFLARQAVAAAASAPRAGSGSSGRIQVDAGGQEILDRTAVRIAVERAQSGNSGSDNEGAAVRPVFFEIRLEVGLPAAGRRILGFEAERLVTGELPRLADAALRFRNLPEAAAFAFVLGAENQEHLRAQLRRLGLCAFVADGAVLPRRRGGDDRPLPAADAVRFASPPSLRVRLSLPHPDPAPGGQAGPRPDAPGRSEIWGMGIPEGLTLIVGGGYHGKSTLLQALARATVPHVPGDGRERCATRDDAVVIRSEEGRPVLSVDVSPFIQELPAPGSRGSLPTTAFDTANASGSTSQAASIMEAIEAGSRLLLIDEDTAANNLMSRDARMRALVGADAEPIVTIAERAPELKALGVSLILAMGGSGAWFESARTVVRMTGYRAADATAEAHRVARNHGIGPPPGATPPARFFARERRPEAASFDPAGRRGTTRVRAARRDALLYGEEEVDLRAAPGLAEPSQTRAAGHAVAVAAERFMDRPVSEVLDALDGVLASAGLDGLTADGRAGRHPGNLARPRRYEIAAVLNRLRRGRMDNRARTAPPEAEASESAPDPGDRRDATPTG